MASPTIGTLLNLTSGNWDSVNHQIFGTFVSMGSSGLLVCVANATATLAQGLLPFSTTVVTSSGLTFSRRTHLTWAGTGENQALEVWTAPFSSSLNQRVNVNFTSGNWNNGAFVFYEVSGLFSTTFPFDAGTGVPSTTTAVSATLSQTYTTIQPDDLIVYVPCGVDFIIASVNESGWSSPGGSSNIDTSGSGYAFTQLFYKSVSGTQSGVTVSSNNRGIGFADAYTGDSTIFSDSVAESETGSFVDTTSASAGFQSTTGETESGHFLDTCDAVLNYTSIPFGFPILPGSAFTGTRYQHNTPILAAFDASGNLSYLNGPNLEGIIITPEIEPATLLANPKNKVKPGDRVRILSSKLSIEGGYDATKTPTVTLRYRQQQEQATTDGPAVAMNIWDECPQRLDTRYVRCLVDIPAGTPWQHIDGVELKLSKSTRR